MLKKSITYTDFNGEDFTEDFYFNLTKAECIKMELGTIGGYTNKIFGLLGTNSKEATANNNSAEQIAAKGIDKDRIPELVQMFEDLILNSYGKKSADGKSFIKTEEIKNEFKCSEAYSVLFMEFVNKPEAFADFVKGVFPETKAVVTK